MGHVGRRPGADLRSPRQIEGVVGIDYDAHDCWMQSPVRAIDRIIELALILVTSPQRWRPWAEWRQTSPAAAGRKPNIASDERWQRVFEQLRSPMRNGIRAHGDRVEPAAERTFGWRREKARAQQP